MITLIHGDDITASRNYFLDVKSKSKEGTTLDGAKISLTDLTQALNGQDLFGDTKEIFIEELLSKRKVSKELDALISVVLEHKESPITIWESKELTPKQVANFKTTTIKSFKIPATIFALLDALRPNNGKQLIELFHKTLEDKDGEFVFFMLQRQVRILLALCHSEQSEESHSRNVLNVIARPFGEGSPESGRSETTKQSLTNNPSPISQISEISRLAPWQKGKLEKQASLFTHDQLLNLHSKLFDIEYGLKTGNLSMPLSSEIDLLLLSV